MRGALGLALVLFVSGAHRGLRDAERPADGGAHRHRRARRAAASWRTSSAPGGGRTWPGSPATCARVPPGTRCRRREADAADDADQHTGRSLPGSSQVAAPVCADTARTGASDRGAPMRRKIATVAAAGVLGVTGLALAGPALAAATGADSPVGAVTDRVDRIKTALSGAGDRRDADPGPGRQGRHDPRGEGPGGPRPRWPRPRRDRPARARPVGGGDRPRADRGRAADRAAGGQEPRDDRRREGRRRRHGHQRARRRREGAGRRRPSPTAGSPRRRPTSASRTCSSG